MTPDNKVSIVALVGTTSLFGMLGGVSIKTKTIVISESLIHLVNLVIPKEGAAYCLLLERDVIDD